MPDRNSITVKGTGPLLQGHEIAIVKQFLDDLQTQAAAQASANVHMYLDRSIRHPTPYYETQITTQRMAEDLVVHDRGIVYGPWLEGTSHMNARTSFKGYKSFERARVLTDKEIPALTQAVLRRYLGRM